MILVDNLTKNISVSSCPTCGSVDNLELFTWQGCTKQFYSVYCANSGCSKPVEVGPVVASASRHEDGVEQACFEWNKWVSS